MGVTLVVFGLFVASAALASHPATSASHSADTVAADTPCADKCPSESPEDLCSDDCPDCTYCHSVAPTLSARVSALNITALPHSKDAIPVASLALSNLGHRIFRPPQSV